MMIPQKSTYPSTTGNPNRAKWSHNRNRTLLQAWECPRHPARPVTTLYRVHVAADVTSDAGRRCLGQLQCLSMRRFKYWWNLGAVYS